VSNDRTLPFAAFASCVREGGLRFDNDGLLDVVTTSFDPTLPMALYRNKGDGLFEDRSKKAGVNDQLGGLVCYQTDYNNDGRMDIYIPRGAWLPFPIRPSLLSNNGDGTFTDVTESTGLLDPVNSNSACWADYDNDGWLDLFVGCERQPHRLYHNRGNGTFEDVSVRSGLRREAASFFSRGRRGSTSITTIIPISSSTTWEETPSSYTTNRTERSQTLRPAWAFTDPFKVFP